MQAEVSKLDKDMTQEEREQHRQIDRSFKLIQDIQLNNDVRTAVGEAVAPVKNLVEDSHEMIATMKQDYMIHNDKIQKLELVYFEK